MIAKPNLPIYDAFLIEDDDLELGVDKISLVKNPANKASFMTFSEDEEEKTKIVLSEDRRLITAVVMLPDFPMYRKVGEKEFYVKYSAETIEQMAFKYMRELRGHSVNVEHNVDVEGVYIVESGVVDLSRGSVSPEGLNLKTGSWWVTFKVDNEKIWESAKDGTFTGISLEGYFNLRQEFSEEIEINLKDEDTVSFESLILSPDAKKIDIYNAFVNRVRSKNTQNR